MKTEDQWNVVTVWQGANGEKHVAAVVEISEPGEPFGKSGFQIIPGCGERWVVYEADFVPLATGYRQLFAKKWIDEAREENDRTLDPER